MSTLSVGTIRSNTSAPPVIQNTSGTEIGTFCRAWVNFNGTGTVAIRASGNVTSITDNGVGDYTVNFTTAMPDANYSATIGATADVISFSGQIVPRLSFIHTLTSSTCRIVTGGQRSDVASSSPYDYTLVSVAIFR